MNKLTEYTLGKTVISSICDEFSDFEQYGTYGKKYRPGCIVRADGSFYEDHLENEEYEPKHIRNELSFFYPPDNGEKIGTELYRKYAKEDYSRMNAFNNQHWSYLVLAVETTINTDSGLTDSVFDTIGGVESDGGKNYLKEMIADLKTGFKQQLLKMGFSDEEINQSVDNAETKKGELYL